MEYSMEQMDELAKNVVEQRIAVPGVQPKLSMSLVKDTMEKSKNTTYRHWCFGRTIYTQAPS